MSFELKVLEERIRNIAKENNEKIDYFLKKRNLPKSLLDNIKKGSIPKADKIYDISKATGYSSDYLLGLSETHNDVHQTIIYRFPVFYQSAAAGIGRLSETEDYQMEEFELSSIPKGAVFGMYIKGHSMEPHITENDVVLIDPSVKISNKLHDKIIIALFGDELICKRLYINNDSQTYDFISDNPNEKDKNRLYQKQNDFKLIGEVVHVIHVQMLGGRLTNYLIN